MPRASRILVAAAILLHALVGTAKPARADVWQVIVECSSRDAIAMYLRDQIHSRVVASGTSHDGHQLVEIWANDGGRFQIVVTPADTRRSCIVGSGVGWTPALDLSGKGSPS